MSNDRQPNRSGAAGRPSPGSFSRGTRVKTTGIILICLTLLSCKSLIHSEAIQTGRKTPPTSQTGVPLAPAAPSTTGNDSTAEIRARSKGRLKCALFFKPAPGDAPNLVADLAPLLFLESPTNNSGNLSNPDLFGKLEATEQGFRTDITNPTLYYETDTANIGGQPHPRITYYWLYSRQQKRGKSLRHPLMQGIRVTLNTSGSPVIWEVLEDSSGKTLVFAADSLEKRARDLFQVPLPGREFALEEAVAKSSGFVVARIIEDGPVPMGPSIYLRSDTRDVLTLTCRCMPPQTGDLSGTRTYQLIPLEASGNSARTGFPRTFPAPHPPIRSIP